MAFVGKIFDNTPSGKRLTKLRDEGLQECNNLNHKMGDYKRIDRRTENGIIWTCKDCGREFFMDFLSGKNKGSALTAECTKKAWL